MNGNLILKGLLIFSLSMTSILANETDIGKIKISQDMNKKEALAVLDKVLSPFEDMTEYALSKDLSGIKRGYKNIKLIKDNSLLKLTISDTQLKTLSQNIEKLKKYIDNVDYTNVALLSSNMFKECIINFKYKNFIQTQIHVEYLDYLGFRFLALLNTKNINYTQMDHIITNAKIHWNAIKENIKDENSVDAFNLLLEGLVYSVKNKNNKMIKILAELDLALVDVIEVQI